MKVWLLVITLMLAGCAQESPDVAVAQDTDEGPEGPALAAGRFATVRVLEQVTFEGTFEAQHSDDIEDQIGVLGQPRNSLQFHDLSQQVPVGQLAALTLEADADVDQGDIDVWLQAPSLVVWVHDCECPFGGQNTVEYVVRVDEGPLELVVQYDEPDNQPAFDYTVDVFVDIAPEKVPGGVPVGVEVQANETVLVRNATHDVTVIGPDDGIVEVLSPASTLTFTVPTSGEYVFLQAEGGAGAEFLAPAALRLVGLRTETVEDLDGPFEATFTLPEVILEIVACAFGDAEQDPAWSFVGPEGTIAEASAPGPHPLGWSQCWSGHLGDPALVAGEHNVTLHHAAGVDSGVVAQWIALDR